MAKPARKSLTDFAANNAPRPGVAAWIVNIPEWPEVLEAWRSGVAQSVIRDWLILECGYDPHVATRSRVAHLSKQYPRTSQR